MSPYFALVSSELDQTPAIWARTPRDQTAGIIAEYKYLVESVASQFGSIHQDFTADGHIFLFENPDAALQFSFRIINAWKQSSKSIPVLLISPHIPLHLGCHFGECAKLENSEAWIGRAFNLVKRVAEVSEPDTLYVTSNVLDVVDLSLYEFKEVQSLHLKGDTLPNRTLYLVSEFYEDILDAKPREETTAQTWFLKGVVLIGTQKENGAEEEGYYRKAIQQRPDYPEAHNNLAVLLKARGDQASAAEHYRIALRLRPQYAEAHYNYAVLLQLRGSVQGAAEHYREALALRKDYVDAHYGFATLLHSSGNSVEAEEHYRQVLDLRPQYPEVHNNYAMLLEDQGNPAMAQRHYQEALRLRHNYPEAHYNYAFLLENQGELEAAEEHYSEALRLRPEYPEAHNNLAILYQRKGDVAKAEQHYVAALQIRVDDPETHYNYALLLNAKGDSEKAAEHFHIAYELSPTHWADSGKGLLVQSDLLNTPTPSAALTRREIDVLRLIAIGKSNREIAQELVISLSTVAHHVTNILNKIGASNRTEAAAYATHYGRMSP